MGVADLLKTSADSLRDHRTIVLESDEIRDMRSFEKHLTAKTLIMPVRSKEELLSFRTDFAKEDILERYEVLGGIPRYIYVTKDCWESRNGGQASVNKAIHGLTVN